MALAQVASASAAYGREENLERRTRRWLEVFDEPDSRPYLAEVDGEVVGVLSVGPAELRAIYIHPDWWGQGVGQALLDTAHRLLAKSSDEAVLTVLGTPARVASTSETAGAWSSRLSSRTSAARRQRSASTAGRCDRARRPADSDFD